ncbi:Alkali-sensitive linkage protein 1 [Psilocybe cubensis]|uniref:Alkali-sensitive linkage protein 1 n=2 Tax=Psilocybe cubensis TaxID=181762 RepID=A0ACB8HBL3_PSICU|nr:Alkali-sensitive linkage protein 1 [Psilocybe cubensis]KAH9484871.1 Alkali-sensitive linkage protein 1 [Psilocybe cubensis]
MKLLFPFFRRTLYPILYFLPLVFTISDVPGSYAFQARDLRNGTIVIPKAGLGWANADMVDMRQFTSTGNVSWYYTWSAFPTEADIEFVPMFWGNKSFDQFNSTMQQVLFNNVNNVTTLLGMNEPDIPSQANVTPEQGVEMWLTYIQPFHDQGLRLGSPAPSSSPAGKAWLHEFLTTCGNNCTVDFIAIHWYGTDASQFITYLEDFNATFGKPLWVTEWACQNYVDLSAQCSFNDVEEFLNITQTYMNQADFVERYVWSDEGFARTQQGQCINRRQW